MTKFLSLIDGTYLNIDHVQTIEVSKRDDWYDVNAFVFCKKRSTYHSFQIFTGFETEEKAQKWLDAIMIKYGLC